MLFIIHLLHQVTCMIEKYSSQHCDSSQKIDSRMVYLFVYPEEVVDSQSGVDEEDGVLPPLQSTDLTSEPQTLCCGAVLHMIIKMSFLTKGDFF